MTSIKRTNQQHGNWTGPITITEPGKFSLTEAAGRQSKENSSYTDRMFMAANNAAPGPIGDIYTYGPIALMTAATLTAALYPMVRQTGRIAARWWLGPQGYRQYLANSPAIPAQVLPAPTRRVRFAPSTK